MSPFNYKDEKISAHDIMFAISSMVIAIGIVSLPSTIAQATRFADGWLSILIAGMMAVLLTWAIAKIAAQFPNESFLSYSSKLVSKPIALLISGIFIVYGVILTAFEVRMVTDISQEYLFEDTPPEVVSFLFLLIVVYAVSGSRAVIFRLNALLLPLVILIIGVLIFFSLNYIRADNLLPVFTTSMSEYVDGTVNSITAFGGFGILFFYIAYVKDAEKAPSRAAIGMASVVILYIALYLICIAVFSQAVTEVLRLPLIELSKSIEIPGGFLERMESIFFVIWIIAIFTTAMMAFDVTVLAIQSIYPKLKKQLIIFMLTPVIFYFALIPNNYLELIQIAKFIGFYSWIMGTSVVGLLWLMYVIRGGKQNGK